MQGAHRPAHATDFPQGQASCDLGEGEEARLRGAIFTSVVREQDAGSVVLQLPQAHRRSVRRLGQVIGLSLPNLEFLTANLKV